MALRKSVVAAAGSILRTAAPSSPAAEFMLWQRRLCSSRFSFRVKRAHAVRFELRADRVDDRAEVRRRSAAADEEVVRDRRHTPNVEHDELARLLVQRRPCRQLSDTGAHVRIPAPLLSDVHLPLAQRLPAELDDRCHGVDPDLLGGRIRGDNLIAQANLDEARARLQQTRELVNRHGFAVGPLGSRLAATSV